MRHGRLQDACDLSTAMTVHSIDSMRISLEKGTNNLDCWLPLQLIDSVLTAGMRANVPAAGKLQAIFEKYTRILPTVEQLRK